MKKPCKFPIIQHTPKSLQSYNTPLQVSNPPTNPFKFKTLQKDPLENPVGLKTYKQAPPIWVSSSGHELSREIGEIDDVSEEVDGESKEIGNGSKEIGG